MAFASTAATTTKISYAGPSSWRVASAHCHANLDCIGTPRGCLPLIIVVDSAD